MPDRPRVGASDWESARESARAARASLLGANASELPTSAKDLLDRALTVAGLSCSRRPLGDALLSGAHAVLDPEAETVWVRADATSEEFAVYVAHELAHFYLHENGNPCRCDEADFVDADSLIPVGYGPRQRRETEANVWAREFLLPSPLARRMFYGDSLDAHAIAARLGLSRGLVFGQLSEALCSPEPEESPPAAVRSADSELPPVPQADPKHPLDPSQAAAAFAERGPLIVGAGPGTGKTRTLTERFLYLTRERGIPPENLLALTFSRKATAEMRERIAAEAPDLASRAAISTFHAFGLDLLRRHGSVLGLPAIPVLLDLPDACALLEKNIGRLGLTVLRYLHDPAYPIPDILRAIGRAKEDLVTPEEFAQRAQVTGEEKLGDVARVYAAYEQILRSKGAIDYSDLICRALRLLQDHPEVRAAEQRQWQHVLVDEYQDVNRAGALLVQALAGAEDAAGLWAVGDIRQAIYRFRGASPANVTRFETDFPTGRRLELSVNYRSVPPLVRLFGRASGEGSDMWEPARHSDSVEEFPAAMLCIADDDIAQADGIARKMRGFRDLGYSWGDQVVLCRSRGQARSLREKLAERGVAVAEEPDEYSPLGARDVRDLIALLSRACEPASSAARHLYPMLPSGLFGGVIDSGDAYDFWAEALWGKPGLARTLTDPPSIVPLLTLARSYRDRAAALLDANEDPRRAFLRQIRRLLRLGMPLGSADSEAGSSGGDADAVRVMTVHASKGLEFPVVFVPNLSAGKFPSRPMPSLIPVLPAPEGALEEESEFAEEERLFFVALTRARDHLVLSRALKYGNISAKASPLLSGIEEAPELRDQVWERDDFGDESQIESWDDDSDGGGGKDALETEPPIDFRDADTYLRCPRRYYYQNVLELGAGIRSPYASFKSAVSDALGAEDPEAALDAAWAARGPDPADPQAAFYRAVADDILKSASASAPLAVANAAAPTFTIALENGALRVWADAATEGGSRGEFRTFRKPPAEDATVPADRRQSLLQEAQDRQGQPEITLQMRYLQTGKTLPIGNKPKQRMKHLAEYDRALRGIRLHIFEAKPADASDCAGCPYLFVCPD